MGDVNRAAQGLAAMGLNPEGAKDDDDKKRDNNQNNKTNCNNNLAVNPGTNKLDPEMMARAIQQIAQQGGRSK